MEESAEQAFVNREEPIPVIRGIAVTSNEAAANDSAPDTERKRDKLMNSIGGSKLKDKVHDIAHGKNDPGHSIQDRFFTKLLQQVIPIEDVDDNGAPIQDKRSSKYIDRPGFSIPLMTNNFRRFNARCGILFVAQTRLIRLLSWKIPSHTLALLAVCTFVCLDPYLLAVIPIALALLFVMVPAFLVRHPPPPPVVSQTPTYSLNGPPLAPPRIVKPAAEMSKDFFRNMRDLQNSMDDFSTVHDSILKVVAPLTNFSNEPLSSTLFLFLFIASCSLFVISHLLPWRFISLSACWTGIALGHPKVQQLVLTVHEEHLKPHERTAQKWLDSWISQDIILDTPAETREVEIFELQRRKGGIYGEWEPWIFSSSPYDPLSPQRISGDGPKGTPYFEDVAAPRGWEWGDKKWVLDLNSREWVEERMVQGVEVEIEGERWVGDLLGEDLGDERGDGRLTGKGKGVKVRDWEEGSGTSRIGEWRRRRWIRMVRRTAMPGAERKTAIMN